MNEKNVIVITGAVGTIGRATTHFLAKQGYHLLLVDNKEDHLKNLSAEIKKSAWASVDVTESNAMEKLFDGVRDNLFGVVLAAGIEGPVGKLEDCADYEFQAVMNVNVMSVWLGIKHSLRILKEKQRGSIVVLSSISGVMAAPKLSPYCASKHAVTGLVKTAAREAASYGVRVNAVCPGPVLSEMMDRIDSAFLHHCPERLNQHNNVAHSVPMQRYAQPEEVASAIGFLCSEESRYCTGMNLTVDGGITCR